MDLKARHNVLTAVALVITLGIAGLLLAKVQNEFIDPGHFAAYEIIWWALVGSLLANVRFVERRPLTSIGFRKPGIRSVVIGIAAGIVILAGLTGIYFALFPALHFKEDPQVTRVMTWDRERGNRILCGFYAEKLKQAKLAGSLRVAFLRQADAAQQLLEARLWPQRVKPGIHPGPNQSIRPFVVSLFEPFVGLSRFSQPNIDTRDIK